MIIERIYVADDGKRFDDEKTCLSYELNLRAQSVIGEVFLFDINGEILTLDNKGFENATFLYCKTDKGAKFIFDKFKYRDLPWSKEEKPKKGCWYYFGVWIPVEHYLKFAKVIESILKI